MKNKLPYILSIFVFFSINSFGNEREDHVETSANSRTKVITQNDNQKESPSDIIQNHQFTRKQRSEKLFSCYGIKYGLGKKVAADSGVSNSVKASFYEIYSGFRGFHTRLLKEDTFVMLQFLADKQFDQFFLQLSDSQSKEQFLSIIEKVSREIINAKHSPDFMFLLFFSEWIKYKEKKWENKTSYKNEQSFLDKDKIAIRYMLYAFLNFGLKNFLSVKPTSSNIFSPGKKEHIKDGARIQDQINQASHNSKENKVVRSIVPGVEQLTENAIYEEEFNSRENFWEYVERKFKHYEFLCTNFKVMAPVNKIIDLDAPISEKSTDNIALEQLWEQIKTLTAEKNDLSVKFNKLTSKKAALGFQLMEKTKELEALNKQLESEKLSKENFQKELQAYSWKTPLMIGGSIVTGAALMYFIYPSIQK